MNEDVVEFIYLVDKVNEIYASGESPMNSICRVKPMLEENGVTEQRDISKIICASWFAEVPELNIRNSAMLFG